MNDITKCKWTNCPLKEDCQRYVLKSNQYQCWMEEQYVAGLECEYQLIKNNNEKH